MRVIDLLNKIANGEEVPSKIKYNGRIYEYVKEIKWYLRDDMKCELNNSKKCLNDEIEIIEDKEEKKIPEKIIPTSLKGIDNLDEKIEIAHIDTISVIETLNQVIDYLKSKEGDPNDNK